MAYALAFLGSDRDSISSSGTGASGWRPPDEVEPEPDPEPEPEPKLRVQVTDENYDEIRAAQNDIRNNWDLLVERSDRYPIILEFCDYRFVFMNEEELKDVDRHIDEGLRAYSSFRTVFDLLHACAVEENPRWTLRDLSVGEVIT